jgi:hypothetical protein
VNDRERDEAPADLPCANCGDTKAAHLPVTIVLEGVVSEPPILVCPRAVYVPER